jgi:hypothetical protein
MPDLQLSDHWDDMIRLLQRLNFDHLDALDEPESAAIAALVKCEPDKAAWLLCEVMRAQSRLPGVQRQLSAYPDVVASAAEFARHNLVLNPRPDLPP